MNRLAILMIFLILTIKASISYADTSTFIGSDQCFTCHDEKKDPWQKNPHNTLNVKFACEACHGPGSIHQDTMDKTKIINPANLDADAVVSACGICHFNKAKPIDKKLWGKSIHSQSGFSCLNCHDPHKVENPKLLVKKEKTEVCYQCHDDKKKAFSKQPHGKNKVACSSCHNPHGTVYENLLFKDSDAEHFCQKCHNNEPHHFISDKGALKMRMLNCRNCHKVHSDEKFYLRFKKEELCVQCHPTQF